MIRFYCYRRLTIPCNKNEYEELLLLNQWLSRASICGVRTSMSKTKVMLLCTAHFLLEPLWKV